MKKITSANLKSNLIKKGAGEKLPLDQDHQERTQQKVLSSEKKSIENKNKKANSNEDNDFNFTEQYCEEQYPAPNF